jgi:hypothetical protein
MQQLQEFPIGVCIKVASLRPRYDNLSEWMYDKKNIYVGRRGRVFIKCKDGEKRIFHYSDSEWCNPFKLKEYSLDESLKKYEILLRSKLEDSDNLKRFLNLVSFKEIGCFCNSSERCHRDIILKVLREKILTE